jgi:hypothetical protein
MIYDTDDSVGYSEKTDEKTTSFSKQHFILGFSLVFMVALIFKFPQLSTISVDTINNLLEQHGSFAIYLFKILNFFFVTIIISMINLFHINLIQRTRHLDGKKICFDLNYFLNASVLVVTVVSNALEVFMFSTKIAFNNFSSMAERMAVIAFVGTTENLQLVLTLFVLCLNAYYVHLLKRLVENEVHCDFFTIIKINITSATQNMFYLFSLMFFSYLTLHYESISAIMVNTHGWDFAYNSRDTLGPLVFVKICSQLFLYFLLYVQFVKLVKFVKHLLTSNQSVRCI